jgi:hypothetical protein
VPSLEAVPPVTRALVAAALALVLAAPAAAQEEKSKCSAAKLRAAGAYAAALAGCAAKAEQKDLPFIDPLCTTRAQQKLAARFAKAERKDDCRTWRESNSLQEILDGGFAVLHQVLVPPPSVCCATASTCFWAADDAACTTTGGTTGAAGTVCSGSSCAPPPASEGPCCEGILPLSATEETCVASPLIDEPTCTGLGGDFVDDAVCLPGRICVD